MSQDLASFSHIAVLGAGAWGTALALAAKGAGRKTTLWVREDDVLAALKAGKDNRFLPGVARPRMSMPSPAVWLKAWLWARTLAPRFWRAALRSYRVLAKRWGRGAKP